MTSVELSNYGEALLNPDLIRIVQFARGKRVAVTFRNGINLNDCKDELLEAFVKHRVREITCSIDGASQETYQIYRVRGEFDVVVGNIERINHFKQVYRSKLPHLTWQFVVFGHNEHEIPIARAMAATLGMAFQPKISWDASLSPVRDKKFVARATGEGAASREEFRRLHRRDYAQETCAQLWDDPQLNWDGKNLGCCRNFWGDFGGNAFADGLAACMTHEKMVHARRMLRGRAAPRDDIPCSTCEIFQVRRENSDWIRRDDG